MTNWEKFKEVFDIDIQDNELEIDGDICNIIDCTEVKCGNCPISKIGMDYSWFWDKEYKER